jgi:phage terminase large subunit-like protein
MQKTIEYHQLLINASETEDPINEPDELVIGNRWGYFDLNSYLKEEETWFRFQSHSALGGCCPLHPANTPIFPEEFSFEKLERRRKQLGNYRFSCQFLNDPASPDDADFNLGDLNYYKMDMDDRVGEYKIIHQVHDGMVMKDLKAKRLSTAMTVDPNHSGNAGHGRCRHAIIVVAVSELGDYYLLDEWVEASSYDVFYSKIFELAQKWNLRRVGVETVAAQKYVKHHIESISPSKGYPLQVDELKGEVEAPDGTLTTKKEWRIRNVIAPILESGHLWVQKRHSNFINELQTFPKGKFKDALDAFAYAPQLVERPMDMAQYMRMLQNNRNQMNQLGRPYSIGAQRYHA